MPHRAGFWIRVLATMIDILVMLSLSTAVGTLIQVLIPDATRAMTIAVYCIWLAYTTFEVWVAATPGKLIFRLRIAEQDCMPAEFWRRVLRWSTKQFWMLAALLFAVTESPVFYALSGFTSLITTVGCLFAANDDHLAWHDQWAHTAVCHWRATAAAPPPLPPQAQPR